MNTIEKPKPGERADRLHARRARQADRQRIGDLIFDILRRAAGPVGEHDDLLLADVGNGVDRDVRQRVIADAQDDQRRQHHEEPVVQAPADDEVDHDVASVVR